MKRRIVILLVVLVLSLATCGAEESRDAILTITKADGSEETITPGKLQNIYDENEINYNNNYRGCDVIVEGYVAEIEQGTERLSPLLIWVDTAEITLEGARGVTIEYLLGRASNEGVDINTITKGTKVRVSGILEGSFIDTEIVDAHDFEIITE